MKVASLLAACIVVLCVPAAQAHPFIDDTSPARLSSAPVGTNVVTVWYSESVEIGFSSLEVFDSAGERVDHDDTSYHEGDASLRVTTDPLRDGMYTVSSKVLSRVDGHLVSSAFIFAVGSATIDAAAAESVSPTTQVFIVEAAAKLPGLVGQTIVLGGASMLLVAWGMRRVLGARDGEAESTHRSRFMILMGAATVMVLASDVLVLAAQAFRLEVGVLDTLGTTFGGMILIRIVVTAALVAVWFAAERKQTLTPLWGAAFVVLGLALAATMTMIGHGAASAHASAVALDYVHNVVASVWIGGVAYLLFVMLPSLSKLDRANAAAMAIVPTFSVVFVSCIGVIAVTGPLLLWLLEDNVTLIAASTYGAILAVKIALGAGMAAMGAYNWTVASRARFVARRLARSLRVEACLGVALLASVALLTNTTLPAGEAQEVEERAPARGLETTIFSANAAFDVSVWPLAAGSNMITVSVVDPEGNSIGDLENVRIKASNPQRGIPPIEAEIERVGSAYSGEITLGFWGSWDIEVEAVRSEAANESVMARTLVKPRLSDLVTEIQEYGLPEGASPLHIVHDGGSTIWLTDPLSPRVWRFDVPTATFSDYAFDGTGSVILDLDVDGRVWFTDIRSSSIVSLDPETGESRMIRIPGEPDASGLAPMPVWITASRGGSIWTTVPNLDSIFEYDPQTGEFAEYAAPPESAPFAIIEDIRGDIWFTGQADGAVTRFDKEAGTMSRFVPDPPLVTAETITFDSRGSAWISEHSESGGIARLDLVTGEFERIRAPDMRSLANSVSFDRHHNAWFALHTVDAMAVYDPDSRELVKVPIPTEESWIQFTDSDPDGNVWFAEQRPAKLGVIRISEPVATEYEQPPGPTSASLAEIVAPLMAGIVIAASLLAVRAAAKRREMLKEFGA